jgi:hypothetical protein
MALELAYRIGAFPEACRMATVREEPFFRPEILGMLYRDSWIGLCVTDGHLQFSHAIAPSAIAKTGRCDIEPALGYAGPIFNTDDAGFIAAATALYSQWCRDHRIIAEVVRFNPHLQNSAPFSQVRGFKTTLPKKLAYMPIQQDQSAMTKFYTPDCNEKLALGLASFDVRVVNKTSWEWDAFVRLYQNTARNPAALGLPQLDDRFFQQAREIDSVILMCAYSDDVIASAWLFVAGRPVSHCLLSIDNGKLPCHTGASQAVLHTAGQLLAGMGSKAICLGGGKTTRRDDPLFAFKMSFGAQAIDFPVGLWTHEPVALRALDAQAAAFDFSIHRQSIFLRYRLAKPFAAGRMAPNLQAFETAPLFAAERASR